MVKSDTADYNIEEFREDKTTLWDGVRNHQARNYLMEMEAGDVEGDAGADEDLAGADHAVGDGPARSCPGGAVAQRVRAQDADAGAEPEGWPLISLYRK